MEELSNLIWVYTIDIQTLHFTQLYDTVQNLELV